MSGEHSDAVPRPDPEASPAETLTIGTTTYRVQMHTFTATLTGPHGGRYTAVQNVHSGLFSVISDSTARSLKRPGASQPLRLRRTGGRFEIA